MATDSPTLNDVMREDQRYPLDAYEFVYEAIEFAKRTLARQENTARTIRHITPAQLVEGVRDLALERYGYLAREVLRRWNIHTSSDVGEIIFNLVRTGDVELGPGETRADFDGLCDYMEELAQRFRIAVTCTDRL